MSELFESKSILTRMLATENLTIEERTVQTACFNVETRVLTIPVLDKNIPGYTYDLFMGHECSHALFTPLEGLEKVRDLKISKSVVNVVEDYRVERLIKQKFPGLKNPFYQGYRDLIEQNFFGTKDRDINSFNLIDRINMFCKGGDLFPTIKFNEKEKELLEKVKGTETFEDVIRVSQELIDYVQNQEDEEEENYQTKKQKTQGDNLGNNSTESETSDEDESNEVTDQKEVEVNTIKDQDSKETKNNSSEIRNPVESETDISYHENEYRLMDQSTNEMEYVSIPKFDMETMIVNYKDLYNRVKKYNPNFKDELFNNMQRKNKNVVNYLVKRFELRKNADESKRIYETRKGEINQNKLFSYKLTDQIFKKNTIVPGGKSHGLVIFLDWSGSMDYYMNHTLDQLFNLVLFCQRVNVPYEVYAFEDPKFPFSDKHKINLNQKKGEFSIREFDLLNILSSKMSKFEFKFAISTLLSLFDPDPKSNFYVDFLNRHSTPLKEAIVAAMEIVPKFQKDNKLQTVNTVFLTDGEGNREFGVKTETGVKSVCYFGYYSLNKKKKTIILRDPVSKHQEKLEVTSDMTYQPEQLNDKITSMFFNLLKKRTESNIVGFYLLKSYEFFRYLKRLSFDGKETEKLKSEWTKNKCVVSTHSGYDEYYLLKIDNDEIKDLQINPNASLKSITNKFTKHSKSKLTNRAILNRFVEKIV